MCVMGYNTRNREVIDHRFDTFYILCLLGMTVGMFELTTKLRLRVITDQSGRHRVRPGDSADDRQQKCTSTISSARILRWRSWW